MFEILITQRPQLITTDAFSRMQVCLQVARCCADQLIRAFSLRICLCRTTQTSSNWASLGAVLVLRFSHDNEIWGDIRYIRIRWGSCAGCITLRFLLALFASVWTCLCLVPTRVSAEMLLIRPPPCYEVEEPLLSPQPTGWDAGGCCWQQCQVRVGCLAGPCPDFQRVLQPAPSCSVISHTFQSCSPTQPTVSAQRPCPLFCLTPL